MKHVRPSVEKTRPNNPKNPDVDRLEEDVNRLNKRWGNCCMQVVERLRSCEAACERNNDCKAYYEGKGSVAGICYISTTSNCLTGWSADSIGNVGDIDPNAACYRGSGRGCFIKQTKIYQNILFWN